jgi:hypothetical protein
MGPALAKPFARCPVLPKGAEPLLICPLLSPSHSIFSGRGIDRLETLSEPLANLKNWKKSRAGSVRRAASSALGSASREILAGRPCLIFLFISLKLIPNSAHFYISLSFLSTPTLLFCAYSNVISIPIPLLSFSVHSNGVLCLLQRDFRFFRAGQRDFRFLCLPQRD